MTKRAVISLILTAAILLSCMGTVSAGGTAKGYIDNSALMPKYVTDDQVALEPSADGAFMSPDWVKTLIVEEVNVAKASPNGKFSGMTYVLEHLQEMGVNGIWLDPIYDGKHYLNYGPHTVSTYLTGTLDYEQGWLTVKEFVDEAHKRNIRVFFDVVTWGSSSLSDLYSEHPDWYKGFSESYGGPLFNWENEEFFNWFLNQLKRMIRDTGADGFRADCGIDYCGPELYKRLRSDLLAEGRKIAIIGEAVTDDNLGIFDFEEHSVNLETGNIWKTGSFYTEMFNIVDSVKNGTGIGTKAEQENGTSGCRRFYSALVSCHDSQNYVADGNLVTMGYASILAPFIPMWFIGEEWSNSYTSTKGWIYSTGINWTLLERNRDYYERVKALIRIRRSYPDIFEDFPQNHRESRICEVKTDHILGLAAYARCGSGRAIIVIPNLSEYNDRFTVTIPYSQAGLSLSGNYKVVNLLTNQTVAAGSASDLIGFETSVPVKNVGVYLVEKASAAEASAFAVSVPQLPESSSEQTADEVTETTGEETTDQHTESSDEKKEDGTVKENKGTAIVWYLSGAAVLAVIGASAAVILIKKRKRKSMGD